jgi:hypothetical protein
LTELGEPTDVHVSGVVPDSVTSLEIVTDCEQYLPVVLTGNAFDVPISNPKDIAGEQVTLDDGTTFFNPDPLSVRPAGL